MACRVPPRITASDTDELGLTNETQWDIERDAAAAGWNACLDYMNFVGASADEIAAYELDV